MKSQRKDGRGHWPAGKHRNPAGLAAAARLKSYYEREDVSLREIAHLLGTDHRTVQRWIRGERAPSPEMEKRIADRLFAASRVGRTRPPAAAAAPVAAPVATKSQPGGSWKWFLTPTAIEQYMRIMDMDGIMDDGNPEFVAARSALGQHSLTAKLVEREDDGRGLTYRSGRLKVRGQSRRLEFVVRPHPRREGSLPQLICVRRK